MRFGRFVLPFILGLAPASLHAATEFPGGLVPMDIVREFTGGTLYKSLPDGFPQIRLPPGLDLRLVGSTSESYSQKVVLRTMLSREALSEQLRGALTAQGWVDLSSPSPVTILRFCHDQYGSLYVNVNSSSGGGNRVDVTRSTFPVSSTCAQQQAQADVSAAWSAFYNARFPRLEMPPETVTTATNPSPYISRSESSSSSGSRIDIRRESSIQAHRVTTASVHAYLALQMRSQGWQRDSFADGVHSAASVWIKYADAPGLSATPVLMLVTLVILRGANDTYEIDVRFQSPPGGGSAFGPLSNSTFP